MMNTQFKIKIIVAILGVIICAFISYLLFFKLINPNSFQVYFLTFLMSLSGSCLSVLLNGKFQIHTLKFSGTGAIGIFAFIFFFSLIYFNNKKTTPFSYTFFLQDSLGTCPLKGNDSLMIRVSDSKRKEPINLNGECTFKQIPSEWKDSLVNVYLTFDGWVFTNLKKVDTIVLNNTFTILKIQYDDSRAIIFGSVRSESDFIDNAEISIDTIRTFSDQYGNFKLTIPKRFQKDSYSLLAYKKGYKNWQNEVYPSLNKSIPIILERK